MKITSMVLAASLALVPATAAMADDKKKEELKKAKEAMKEKMKEAAKEKAEKKTEKALEKVNEKKADAAAANAADKEAAAKAEKELHAKNLGAIERLDQIATATNNADLKAVVARLNEKETKRHTMAIE